MYTDDNSDKESEYDDRNPDSPNITKKSLSTVGFRSAPESDCARPLGLRATQSFTGAVEELRLCNNFQRIDMCNRMNAVSTPKISTICPCGCLLRPASAVPLPFRTRELNTLLLHVVSPEVLSHHGYNFEPRHIALFWKKDCRTFLWKGKSKMKNVIHAESHKK